MDSEDATVDAPAQSLQYAHVEPAETVRAIDLLVVALKVLGVYECLQGVPLIALVPIVLMRGNQLPGGLDDMWMYALPSAIPLACGVVLIGGARWIATRLLGTSPGRPYTLGAPGQQLQAAAFSVVGVTIFVIGTVQLVPLIVAGDISTGSVSLSSNTGVMGALVQMLAGAILFFRSKGIASLWHKFQRPHPLREDEVSGLEGSPTTSSDAAPPSGSRSG